MLITRLWRSQPGKYFCISTKSATGKWHDEFFTRDEFPDVWQYLRDHKDKDLYFCPHGFSKDRRLKPYAVLPNLLWADLDEADPREVKFKPTVAVESSPGRFVGLWLLDRPMTESINRRLAYMMGADKSGWDLTQVLRVPGTTNYKYDSMPRTRILWSDGPEYKISDIERRLPDDEIPDANEESDAAEVYKRLERKFPHWLRRELINGKPTIGKRSDMLWKIGNGLLEVGVTHDDWITLIKASAWNKFAGRRNEDEQLEREWEKATNKHFQARKPVAGEDENEEDDYVWLGQTLEEVEEENIDWIWYPYLARGELSILEGDPDLGKSYVAEMVGGHIIDGLALPSVKKMPAVKGKVVYFDIENSAGTITKKRILGNGFKNLSWFLQEEALFSIDDDDRVAKILEALERVKPTLVVFDTLNTYLGKADAFKGHEAQQAFARFRKIAKRFNCAVLVLRHLTKSSKERALYRGQGSIAFTGLARSVIMIGKLPDDPEQRAIAVNKLNIAVKPPALTFSIEALSDTFKEKDRSKFKWGEFVEGVTAEELISTPKEEAGTERKEAHEFLKEILGEGEIEFRRIEKMAGARSIAIRTVQRAAEEMNVVRKSRGFGKAKSSVWSLPAGQ